MSKRRGNGEGSITRHKKSGLYMARYTAWTASGQKRKAIYGKTRAEVAEKLTRAMADRDQGLLFDAGGQTLGEYVTRWLEDSARGDLAPRTYSNYSLQVRRHINPVLGRAKLSRLSPDNIQALYAAKLRAGLAPSSVLYIHAVLHRALETAARRGTIPRNPAAIVDPPKVRREEIEPLDARQTRALLRAAGEAGDRFECIYVLALTCGLRIGELLGLKWTDIDLEAGTLRVNRQLQRLRDGSASGLVFSEPKNASRRQLRLPDRAVAALRSHRKRQFEEKLRASNYEDSRLVFATGKGTPLDAQNVVNRSFKPLLKKAGLPDVRFHDLRHTCATLLLSREVPMRSTSRRSWAMLVSRSQWTSTATGCRTSGITPQPRWKTR